MRSLRTLIFAVVAVWVVVRLAELGLPLLRPAPWTPAQLTALDGPATAATIAGVRDDPRWCRTVLKARRVPFTRVPDRVTGPGCGFAGSVRLDASLWMPRQPVVTCPVAVALSFWERGAVRPAAQAQGRRLTAIEHFGSYNCRSVAGTGRTSQHATANAIDIAGFRFAAGPPVSVRRDWGKGAGGVLLQQAHKGACQVFGTTLGPGYNAAHRDHLHLDMAKWAYCP